MLTDSSGDMSGILFDDVTIEQSVKRDLVITSQGNVSNLTRKDPVRVKREFLIKKERMEKNLNFIFA